MNINLEVEKHSRRRKSVDHDKKLSYAGNNSAERKDSELKHPGLLRISDAEAQSIASCFRLYDYDAKGTISKESAIKLIKSLGYTIPTTKMSSVISLQEFLLVLDQWSPRPDPPLECSLATWSQLVGHRRLRTVGNDTIEELAISAEDIAAFMESIGKPPISLSEANCLLTSMLEYDDCSEIPEVSMESFVKQISLFARKSNLLRDVHKLK